MRAFEPTMIRHRSTIVLVAGLTAGIMNISFAQNSASVPSEAELIGHCEQPVKTYDLYGAGRSENSDGARNHTRIGACVDCTNGRAGEGIETMTALLLRKNFDLPPRDVARFPSTTKAPCLHRPL